MARYGCRELFAPRAVHAQARKQEKAWNYRYFHGRRRKGKAAGNELEVGRNQILKFFVDLIEGFEFYLEGHQVRLQSFKQRGGRIQFVL